MRIIVIRGKGDFQADDIVDPLISDIRAALSRGQKELDEGEGLQKITISTLFRANVAKGDLIEYDDLLQGQIWRGIITAISHVADGGRLLSQLTIKRRSN